MVSSVRTSLDHVTRFVTELFQSRSATGRFRSDGGGIGAHSVENVRRMFPVTFQNGTCIEEATGTMRKISGWVLSLVTILCVASIVVSVVVLGRLTTLTQQIGVMSSKLNTTQTSQTNATSPATTTGHDNATTSGNTTAPSNGTTPPTGASASFTNADAVHIAGTIPGIQNLLKTDKNATAIPQGSHTNADGTTYITLEYADNMSTHVAALYWIDVRSDGLVRNAMTQGPWVEPSQFTLSN